MYLIHDLPLSSLNLVDSYSPKNIYPRLILEGLEIFPEEARFKFLKYSKHQDFFDATEVAHFVKNFGFSIDAINLPSVQFREEETLDLVFKTLQSFSESGLTSKLLQDQITLVVTPQANTILDYGYCLDELIALIGQLSEDIKIVVSIDSIYDSFRGGVNNLLLRHILPLGNQFIIGDVPTLDYIAKLTAKYKRDILAVSTDLAFKNGYNEVSFLSYPSYIPYWEGDLANFHLIEEQGKSGIILENIAVLNRIID